MAYFKCRWQFKYGDELKNVVGFIKADTLPEAEEILKGQLSESSKILEVKKCFSHQITPQSLCMNFRAPDYKIFG